MAVGAFNSSQFQSSIALSRYCVLSTEGASSAVGMTAGTQAWKYPSDRTSTTAQSCLIFAEKTETIARRGLLLGLNCTSAPVSLK